MEPAVAVVLRLMSLGEVQFSGKGRTSINLFFKSSWSNKLSPRVSFPQGPPQAVSLFRCPQGHTPAPGVSCETKKPREEEEEEEEEGSFSPSCPS